MPNFSYVQTDFRGGLWSITSQGRMEFPGYKTGLNECLNSLPTETGAWTRRPGFRFITHPKGGKTGKLLPFRFSRTQAYQAELTPGWMRFVVGLTLLRVEPLRPIVVNINNATPAKVKVSALPWANGDTVMFNIVSNPPSSYTLYNRQFVIRNVDAVNLTFTLEDPITGAPIAGTEIAWANIGGGADTVQKVFEFSTPYLAADIPNVRVIQDSKDTVLFMCPGKKTYALVVSGATQFTFGVADFQDGPYLDENKLVTTMALSGLSGSVNVTASGTAGINSGAGFVATDVGRLIWFQGGPAAWNNATPYANNAKVLGSDNNIYRSLRGNNLNNNPTVDLGANWEISPDVVSITWLQITAVASTTSVTATIRGQAVTSGAATINWRMGAYSDTTGYPTCGAYHEGRLVLAGAIVNRFDMSVSLNSLTFSPTEVDGTVSDSNSVSGTLNNKDAELISVMLSVDEGLFIGTLSGEWVIRASALDDPVSPTSVQARSPNNSGSAPVEVMRIYGSPVFVQGRQRKILTNRKHYTGRFENVNNSKFASNLTSPKIVETAWCPEPMMSFFCRMSDGKLAGATHSVSILDESFTGWHRHDHALKRKFEALSGGPDFSGTSDSIFVITAHPTDPTAPRWIETLMPTQNEGDPDWVAWHTDGSGTASYIRRMITANGDAFDGVRVYGLWYLNGQTVHPYIGGLDLGDFIVTLGSIDIPYTGVFTAAFLASLSNGTDYSNWGIKLRWADAPVTTQPLHPLNTLLILDSETTTTASGDKNLWDRERELYYRIKPSTSTIRVIDALSGDLVREAPTYQSIFPDQDAQGIDVSGGGSCTALVGPDTNHPNGSIIALVTRIPPLGADYKLGLIDCVTLKKYSMFKTNGPDGTATNPPKFLGAFPLYYVDPNTLLITSNNFVFVSNLSGPTDVRIYSVSASGPLGGMWNQIAIANNLEGHDFTLPFRGFEVIGLTVFYSYSPIGNTSTSSFSGAYNAVIREWFVGAISGSVANEKLFNLSALTMDPTWVNGYENFSVTYIADDNTFLVVANGFPGLSYRIAKVDRYGNFVWNTLTPNRIAFPPTHHAGPWNYRRWSYMDATGVVRNVNLDDGSVSTLTGMTTGTYALAGYGGEFDEVGPSLITYSNFNSATGSPNPAISYLGTYANAHHDLVVQNFTRIWLGTTFTQSQIQRVINAAYNFVPTNFGVSYVSRGQLLRPDFGQDAGAIMGPAFGKKRRNHWWAGSFLRSFKIKVGTDFAKLFPVVFKTPGNTPLQQPTLFSGVVSDTLKDDYSFEGKLAWEVTRQYPCTITAIGGYIETQDK